MYNACITQVIHYILCKYKANYTVYRKIKVQVVIILIFQVKAIFLSRFTIKTNNLMIIYKDIYLLSLYRICETPESVLNPTVLYYTLGIYFHLGSFSLLFILPRYRIQLFILPRYRVQDTGFYSSSYPDTGFYSSSYPDTGFYSSFYPDTRFNSLSYPDTGFKIQDFNLYLIQVQDSTLHPTQIQDSTLHPIQIQDSTHHPTQIQDSTLHPFQIQGSRYRILLLILPSYKVQVYILLR